MRKTITHGIIVLTVLLLITGCNAILLPSTQKITINTGNDKSQIYINNELWGEGSNVTGKIKKQGFKDVVIQTDGYRNSYYVLAPYRRVKAFTPLYIMGIPTIFGMSIDLVINKAFVYPKENEFPPIIRNKPRQSNEKYILLKGLNFDIRNKHRDISRFWLEYEKDIYKVYAREEKRVADEWKASEANKVKTLDTEVENVLYEQHPEYAERLVNIIKSNSYIDTVSQIFLNNGNTLVLEGVVKKIGEYWVRSKSFFPYTYKKVKLDITWYIANGYGEILDSINSSNYSGDFMDQPIDTSYANAIEQSFAEAFNDDLFNDYLQADSNFNIQDKRLDIDISHSKIVKDVDGATAASVIIKRTDNGHGSGFAISEDGYILTNFHVLAGKYYNKLSDVTVVLADGEEVPAKVVRYNRMHDVALLKVDRKFETVFALSKEKAYKRTMEVYTVGTPKSIELGQSVSIGLISNERKANNNNLLQLSMSINSGNSGGPLFDKEGNLHGIVTSKLVGFSTEGVGFAIPSYQISDYLNLDIK